MEFPSVVREHVLLAVVFAVVCLPGSGCEDATTPSVDAGLGRRLEIVQVAGAPPAGQIGLRYEQSAMLLVRYVLGDGATPVHGEAVRFAIFDDPAGSTLARDLVETDNAGYASVVLSAGNHEGSFRVRASAAGANDVEFSISVSSQEFVQITAAITDPLPGAGTHTLTAALYSGQRCADLGITPSLAGSPRVLQVDSQAVASLAFVNLLSRDYAMVARVGAGTRLLAYGCVDVDHHLASPGATLHVPVAVFTVTPSVVGQLVLSSQIGTSRAARGDDLWKGVDVLDRCRGHLGQLLLDELASRVGLALAAAIASARGIAAPTDVGVSTISCYPAAVGAMASLDAELSDLLEASATGVARAGLIGDFDQLLASGALGTRLTLTPTSALATDGPHSPRRLVVEHRALEVVLRVGITSHTYDLDALGWPSTTTSGIAASTDMGSLTIARHGLAIALPELWGLGFGALALKVRLPSLTDTTWTGWVAAAVAATTRNGSAGCAAIENLVCERTGVAGCTGTLVAPCAAAVTATGAALDQMFAREQVLTLEGSASAIDDDGDLVADGLAFGAWTAAGPIESQVSFSGKRMAQ